MKDFHKITRMALVVDMINGFVKYGAMHDKSIAKIIPNQIELLHQFHGENDLIAIVKDTHEKECMEFKTYPEHCVRGSGEENLVDELSAFENENALVYEKNSTDVTNVPQFFEDIKNMPNLKEIVVIGCCTDICVLNAAISMRTYFNQENMDIDILIPKDCVETYDAPVHPQKEYNEMAYQLISQSGVKVVETYKNKKTVLLN